MSINKVIVTGNLTRDPEVRRTQSGLTILNFSIAVNDNKFNKQANKWEDYANFFDCTMFGECGEKLADRLSKGTKVAIEGKLRWTQWEHNGQKKSKVEIYPDKVEIFTKAESKPKYESNNDDDFVPFDYGF